MRTMKFWLGRLLVVVICAFATWLTLAHVWQAKAFTGYVADRLQTRTQDLATFLILKRPRCENPVFAV